MPRPAKNTVWVVGARLVKIDKGPILEVPWNLYIEGRCQDPGCTGHLSRRVWSEN